MTDWTTVFIDAGIALGGYAVGAVVHIVIAYRTILKERRQFRSEVESEVLPAAEKRIAEGTKGQLLALHSALLKAIPPAPDLPGLEARLTGLEARLTALIPPAPDMGGLESRLKAEMKPAVEAAVAAAAPVITEKIGLEVQARIMGFQQGVQQQIAQNIQLYAQARPGSQGQMGQLSQILGIVGGKRAAKWAPVLAMIEQRQQGQGQAPGQGAGQWVQTPNGPQWVAVQNPPYPMVPAGGNGGPMIATPTTGPIISPPPPLSAPEPVKEPEEADEEPADS